MPLPPTDLQTASRDALRTLGWEDDPLAIDGVPCETIAAEFGTPFYAFSARTIERRVDAVRRALGPRVDLLYSIKANPSLALTARLREHGVGAEVASLGELHLAIAAGHDAATLRFAGPGKTDDELGEALGAGLGCFHIESESEVDSIAAIASARGVRAGIAVRVNLPGELGGSRLRMGGFGSGFGVDAERVPALLERIAADPALNLRGLHVYAGTQSFDATAFVAHARGLLERAAAWERDLGLRLDEIDLGGGFGVPTYVGDPEFDLEAAGKGVRDLIEAHDRPGRVWMIELGRYLVAPAGVFVARAVRRKRSGSSHHIALDGGLNHCAMAAGVGTVLRRTPLLLHAGSSRGEPTEPISLGGPLCTPADRFGDEIALPRIDEGDLVACLHAGAYGLTFSPSAFLGHPTPAEVLVENRTARLVRVRGEADDALRGQHT